MWMKRISIIALIVALAAAFAAAVHFGEGSAKALTCITPEAWETVAAGKERLYVEPREDRYGMLTIEGESAPYDSACEAGRYCVPVSVDARISDPGCALEWSNALADAYVLAEPGCDLTEAVGANRVFRLMILLDNGYFERELVFTGLPCLTIETNEKLSVYYGKDEKQGGILRVFDPDGGADGGYRVFATGIRYEPRGGCTVAMDKPQYRIELRDGERKARRETLLGLAASEEIILSAQLTEQSRIRNDVCQRLWNALCDADPGRGNRKVQDYEYADVIEQNEYIGLYGVMEGKPLAANAMHADDVLLKIRHAVSKEDAAEAKSVFDGRTIPACAEEAIRLTAGSPAQFIKALDYLSRYVFRTEPRAESFAAISEDLRLDNAVDYALFTEMTVGADNRYANFYLYGEADGEGGMQFARIPWDMDRTFAHPYGFLPEEYDPGLVFTHAVPPEMQFLLDEHPDEIWPLLTARWKELRAGVFSEEALCALVDERAEILTESGAYAREYERWGYMNFRGPENLKSIMRARLFFLDNYFAGDAPAK